MPGRAGGRVDAIGGRKCEERVWQWEGLRDGLRSGGEGVWVDRRGAGEEGENKEKVGSVRRGWKKWVRAGMPTSVSDEGEEEEEE